VSIQELIGKPLGEFMRDRGFALFDAVLASLVIGAFIMVLRYLSHAKMLVGYSLRAKLTAGVSILAALCVVGWLCNVNPLILLIGTFVVVLLLVQWVLHDLTLVGITNAFETTKQGVSAEDSLKQVKRDLVFLGIGAKKLTDSPEFEAMLRRCKIAGGSAKFLLSSPDNEALEEKARQNGRNDLSYRSRVRESIREIFTRGTASGVDFEVRMYNLKQQIALPQFRLVFIDDKLCIFSQLRWTEAEGLDNPQLILLANQNSAASSLYQGYRDYFEYLWSLDTTEPVTKSLIDGWPV
jgi:hypothetical protein